MSVGLPLACVFAALAIGAVVEVSARVFNLWTYRSPAFLVLNILVVFGLIQGYGVGWVIGGRSALRGIFPVLFMVGAVLGILVEGLNEHWLHAWSWSDRPLIGVTRSIDKAAVVGVAWGFAPLASVILARLMIGASLKA
jgi:hypothetical protein